MANRNITGLHPFSYTALALTALFWLCFSLAFTEANNFSLSIDLIHRDSPKSPFYNESLTYYDRVKVGSLRSFYRESLLSAGLEPSRGEFLLEMYYGTPAAKTLALFDTGSTLTWLQCQPCTCCFPQRGEIFNPSHSSTFKKMYTPGSSTPAPYEIKYEDGSFSNGYMASDVIRIGSNPTTFPDFIFGCGEDNGGTYVGASGVVAFGMGRHSIVAQLLEQHFGANFSYCLGPFTEVTKVSKLHLGDNPVIWGPGLVSTPLIIDDDKYYLLVLEAISVGNTRLRYRDPQSQHPKLRSGEILLDTGARDTFFPEIFYLQLESTMKQVVGSNRYVRDSAGRFRLCYSPSERLKIPIVTMHFKDGANLKLTLSNTFIQTSPNSLCMAFVPFPNARFSVFGNVAQANFWVNHDLRYKYVTFKPAICTPL